MLIPILFVMGALFCFGYMVGDKTGYLRCVNDADILHSDTNDIISIYLPGDIMHIYFARNEVYFEQGGDPLEFNNREAMYDYIEEATAFSSSIHGYKNDLDWLIQQGYIFANTVHNDDEQYTDLIYRGPNWTVDTSQDTSYIISTFNNVEKLYNPKTKTIHFESYSID